MNKTKIKERLKGALWGVLLTILVVTAIPAFARATQETITVNFNNIRIAVNGQHVQTEFEPFIFQGRTYLPVRDVAYAMGFDATWEESTNTVHLTERGNSNLNVAPNYPAHRPTQTTRPANPTISLQRAIEIAEADLVRRGIAATFHSDSGMDWERGQWVWELEFRVTGARRGRHVIEFYINVDTGDIVKFEWDS
jgi:uncharacterized membrane protein YkoI